MTEIGGWIDRLAGRKPRLVNSLTRLISVGRATAPERAHPRLELHAAGRDRRADTVGPGDWRFGARPGAERLNKPSLAVRLPNGLIAANDDWNHRVVISTRTPTGSSGSTATPASPGRAGLPRQARRPRPAPVRVPSGERGSARAARPEQGSGRAARERQGSAHCPPRCPSRRRSPCPAEGSSWSAASSTARFPTAVLAGTPSRLRALGRLPCRRTTQPRYFWRSASPLYGGGASISTPAVVRWTADGSTRELRSAGRTALGSGRGGRGRTTYLVGGYTAPAMRARSSASAVATGRHRGAAADRPRYAGVAALGDTIYVAGGVTPTATARPSTSSTPATSSVRRVASLPSPVAHAPLASLDGRLYLFAGQSVLRIDPGTGRVRRRIDPSGAHRRECDHARQPDHRPGRRHGRRLCHARNRCASSVTSYGSTPMPACPAGGNACR